MPDDVQPEVESGEQTEVTGEPGGNQQPVASAEPEADSPAQTTVAVESEQPAKKTRSRQRTPRSGRSTKSQRAATAVAEEPEPDADEAPPPPRLLDVYRNEIVPALMREFGFDNPMRVPRIKKIVLNIGVGEALTDSKALEGATRDLTNISGQKPVATKARKSIAGFQSKRGQPHRDRSDPAGRSNVPFLGPADQHRSAAYPRLPGDCPRRI